MLPNFLIIGAPRAGTSWISRNIRLHPDVYMAKIKEIHFFDRSYDKGMSYYEKFFDGWTAEKAGGEATPAYLYKGQVPGLIHRHLPNVKLIVSLRNPVDRLYSRFWNCKAKYFPDQNISFEEKIRIKPSFIEEGFYYDHLMRYYRFFPKEKMKVMLFDDLKKDPEGFLRTIYEYLEVDAEFNSPFVSRKMNSAIDKRGLSKSNFLWYLNKVTHKLKAYGLSNKINDLNKIHLPPMKKETRQWLVKEVYFKKNRDLENLIGRDLSSWYEI